MYLVLHGDSGYMPTHISEHHTLEMAKMAALELVRELLDTYADENAEFLHNIPLRDIKASVVKSSSPVLYGYIVLDNKMIYIEIGYSDE